MAPHGEYQLSSPPSCICNINIFNELDQGFFLQHLGFGKGTFSIELLIRFFFQLVKIVNTSKSFRSGGAISRFYGGAYAISTREKREKEKEERSDCRHILIMPIIFSLLFLLVPGSAIAQFETGFFYS